MPGRIAEAVEVKEVITLTYSYYIRSEEKDEI